MDGKVIIMFSTTSATDLKLFSEFDDRFVNPEELPGRVVGDYDVKSLRTNTPGFPPYTKHLYFSRHGDSNRFVEKEAVFRIGRAFPGGEDGYWRVVLHFGTEKQYIRWGDFSSDIPYPQPGSVTLESERDGFDEGGLILGRDYQLERSERNTGEKVVYYNPYTAKSGYLFVTSEQIRNDNTRPDPFIIPIPSSRQAVYAEAPDEVITPVRAFGDFTELGG